MKNFYAVKVGYHPGIYNDYESARRQISGYSNAEWKGFAHYEDVKAYFHGGKQRKSTSGEPKIKAYYKPTTRYYVKGHVIYDETTVGDDVYGAIPCHSWKAALDEIADNGYQTYKIRVAQELSYVNDKGKRIYVVYTDGACQRNGCPDALAGYGIFFGKHNPDNFSSPLRSGRQTNQRAELMAVGVAMEILAEKQDEKMYIICTDSMYAMNCLTKWCVKWAKNGYINSKGFPVENQDVIKKILKIYRTCDNIKSLRHVEAHSGNEFNDEADRLAKKGIMMR